MKIRSLEYIVEEAFTGIHRNGLMAFASISTIALSLGVLGAFVLTALSANHFAAAQIGDFRIAVFMDTKVDRKQTDAVADKIRHMDNVSSVLIRDREKEWTDFKRNRPDIESAGLPLNVLPYSMDVKVADAARLSVVASRIRAMDNIDAVKEGREVLGRVMAVAQVAKVISIVGVVVLLITTIFIISNAIKLTLYARRREIGIMQLVGATNQFIRLPLVIEGMFFGAAGALVAWLLLHIGSSYLSQSAQRVTGLVSQLQSGVGSGELAVGLVVLGTAIGAVGSMVSIRRFLRD